MSLDKCLQEIKDRDTPVSPSLLFDLSNLMPPEEEAFTQVWTTIPAPRRLAIVERLVDLAQDSAELDFNKVFRHCLNDKDPEVREKALEGLWEDEDRLLISTLCDITKDDPSPKVRAAAAMALGKFAILAQEGKLLEKDSNRTRECLLITLQDASEDLEVRRRALEAAAVFDASRVKELIKWAYESDNLDLKRSSLYAMGKTGDPYWLSFLFKELKNPNPPLRYEAANACGELEEEEAIPHLMPLTEDDDLQVQLSAIQAIGTIGGPLAKKALRRCLKSGDVAIEDAAREYLEIAGASEDLMALKYTP